MSDVKVQDHHLKGSGLYFLLIFQGFEKNEEKYLGNLRHYMCGTGVSGYILTYFAHYTIFIISSILLWARV